MKIAILGLNDASLSVAHELQEFGAQVVLFSHQKKSIHQYDFPCLAGKIRRVQKRFLKRGETIEGKSRLADLFRVVYDYRPEIDEDSDLEFWQKFKQLEKDHSYLLESSERFIDVDLVIDMLRAEDFPNPMGAAGTFALNERGAAKRGPIFYGESSKHDFLSYVKAIGPKRLAIIGEEQIGLEVFLESKKLGVQEFVIVTCEEKPWQSFDHQGLSQQFREVLDQCLRDYELAKESFYAKINSWKDLEDFERTKTPKPTEPSFPLIFCSRSAVTAIDCLSDQKDMFLTVESIDLTQSRPHQTLASEAVFVATGYERDYSYLSSLGLTSESVLSDEVGYFFMKKTEELPCVLQVIMKFFSRA